ncbi:PREDICTED: aspartic proteinase CDR1-like [Lupinus angustifolius]|uniref:aspartic proteinase CDR1-like n=1 Tax=Lupinus angustifolius TaxID=3871 RepID=UPI00092FC552|nr:PREDICTED: aspartic proteinase CDR1-like [Lupinus angustifolius]
MNSLVFFFCFALCSPSIVSFAKANENLSGFIIDLIHRDSPLSPFYNSSMTPSQLIKSAAMRSITRFNRVQLSFTNENHKPIPESIIILDNGEYLMRIYIGTPPVERLVVADTGSDLTWVQCAPCKKTKCFPQNTPLFNPRKSSTFRSIPCHSKHCTRLQEDWHECGNSGECKYTYLYGDNSFTNGNLAIDSIKFDTNTRRKGVKFPKSIFGCGHNNIGTFGIGHKATGIVGLGAGPLSLVSQLGHEIGHKFSYCLVPFSSTTNSKLKFGNHATISGNGVVSTPLIIKSSSPTFYYLCLKGITVGKECVEQIGHTHGNIIIDSGTTLTFLEPSFYNGFVTLVKKVMGVEPIQNPPKPLNFCFSYVNNMNFTNFIFHFKGANVPLNPKNLFIPYNNLICLAVLPNTQDGISILGNVAQIDFQVEYDLEGKKVSFLPTDCTKN